MSDLESTTLTTKDSPENGAIGRLSIRNLTLLKHWLISENEQSKVGKVGR